MPFVEHNNRKIADQYAEFITSDSLRKFVGDRVASYLGDIERQPFSADLYISIRNDEIVNIQALKRDEYLMTRPRYEEMLARQGYEVIHKKDLKEIAKKYLLKIL